MLTSPESEKHPPTDEQVAILDAIRNGSDNLLINALAGSGKTNTIERIVEELPHDANPLYVAFNKAIVDEAKEKLPDYVEIRTLNSIGHQAWKAARNEKLVLDPKNPKVPGIVREICNGFKAKDDRDEAWDNYYDIVQAINMSKHLGYIPGEGYKTAKRLCDRDVVQGRIESRLTDFCWEIVDTALLSSIDFAFRGFIDYDDQIYMSALFGGSFQRYPIVLVDENQDLDPCNFEMLRQVVEERLVGVGDRWQSIYAFRGADTHSVDKLKGMFNMTEMPLSISFRCPENVVKAVHWHVPHMRWHKDGGYFKVLQSLDVGAIPDGAAIVCRNNAPLFAAAFQLLSAKRSVSVVGSDIGPKIIKLMSKIANEKDPSDVVVGKIEEWKVEKLRFANNVTTIMDTAECMKIFATWGETLWHAIKYAHFILAQQGTITLTTGHKSKGREWDTVYHLNPGLCRDDDQDRNLKYVITTRAKFELYEIDEANIQWL